MRESGFETLISDVLSLNKKTLNLDKVQSFLLDKRSTKKTIESMSLQTHDLLFTLLHLTIIGFNLFGWIWKPIRKFHFGLILLTALSWFVLGIWFGIGYCPITDWQWQIKEKLGEHNLPNSFIKYYLDKISGTAINSSLINTLTALGFFVAATLSVYINFFNKKPQAQ